MSFQLIPTAYATTTSGANTMTGAHHGSGMGFILMWVVLLAVLYFVMWRPQSQRMKKHRKMLEGVSKGDEVVTNGGVFGKVEKVDDNFVILTIAEGITIKVQKQAISATLPKGSI